VLVRRPGHRPREPQRGLRFNQHPSKLPWWKTPYSRALSGAWNLPRRGYPRLQSRRGKDRPARGTETRARPLPAACAADTSTGGRRRQSPPTSPVGQPVIYEATSRASPASPRSPRDGAAATTRGGASRRSSFAPPDLGVHRVEAAGSLARGRGRGVPPAKVLANYWATAPWAIFAPPIAYSPGCAASGWKS